VVLARRTVSADARVPRALLDVVVALGMGIVILPELFWFIFLLAPLVLVAALVDPRLPLAFGIAMGAWITTMLYVMGLDPVDAGALTWAAAMCLAGLVPLAVGWLVGRRRARI
jgi:hypothetical protein